MSLSALWHPLLSNVCWSFLQAIEGNFILSFTHKLPESRSAIVYIAFCFPFSYSECQAMLGSLQARHSFPWNVQRPENSIYFHRELLCYSLERRRVDLITVSSCAGITNEREARLDGLFPESSTERSRKFEGKKVRTVLWFGSPFPPVPTVFFVRTVQDFNQQSSTTSRQIQATKLPYVSMLPVFHFQIPFSTFLGVFPHGPRASRRNTLVVCTQWLSWLYHERGWPASTRATSNICLQTRPDDKSGWCLQRLLPNRYERCQP